MNWPRRTKSEEERETRGGNAHPPERETGADAAGSLQAAQGNPRHRLARCRQDELTTNERKLAAHYRTIAILLDPVRSELATTEKKRTELFDHIPKTQVAMADKPRDIRVLPRGNWLDDSGEVVSPAVPHFLAAARR